jgi:hypothetical protein
VVPFSDVLPISCSGLGYEVACRYPVDSLSGKRPTGLGYLELESLNWRDSCVKSLTEAKNAGILRVLSDGL